MWKVGLLINKLVHEICRRLNKCTINVSHEVDILTVAVILAEHKNNNCCLVFLDGEFFSVAMQHWMPRTADSSVWLVLVHQIALGRQNISAKFKESSRLVLVAKAYERP